jgi:NarL family two-component system sensor histidine kinase LiaS
MSSPTLFGNRFEKLRWKLTLSYTGVTVGALLTVELILLLGTAVVVTMLLNSGILQAELINATAEAYMPPLRFMLSQTQPDQDEITNWLDQVSTAVGPTLPLTFNATEQLFIVGQDGTLLGSTPTDLLGSDSIGYPVSTAALPGLAQPLQAALAGDEDVDNLYNLPGLDESVIMAIPIWDASNETVLGVIVGVGDRPTVRSVLRSIIPIMGSSFLVFTLIAGVAGTIYGSVAARGLSRRLDRLSQGTQAWSQGDFSEQVEDASGDEIGQLAQQLNQMAGQLQQLIETRRELVVVDERNRLARELHDSAKQQAFAAAAQISAAKAQITKDSEKAAQHIEEAEHLIYDLRQELTSLIQELRPAALQGKGLYQAVNEYGEDWARQNDIEFEVLSQAEQELPWELELTIFRIIQGALSNTARHSRASKVEIVLQYASDAFACTIRDDGIGFMVEQKVRGFGLRSMHDRAAALGGTVSVTSTPGTGTEVVIAFAGIGGQKTQ